MKNIDYYAGIDLGTTSLKMLLYGADGTAVSQFRRAYPLINRGGFVDSDTRLWKDAVFDGLAELERAAVNAGGHIRAVSVSSQGITFVPVNAGGEPLCDAISWLDQNAADDCAKLRARFGESHIYGATGKPLSPTYTLPKLMRQKRLDPGLFEAADKFLMPLELINLWLCGEPVTDLTMASGTMLFDINSAVWDGELLDFAGIDERKLPRVSVMGEPLGSLTPAAAERTGLAPDTMVALGGQDQKLAALGAGIDDGICTVSLGTSTAISKLGNFPQSGCPRFRYDADTYVTEASLPTTGAALKWVAETMFPGRPYSDIDSLVEKTRRLVEKTRLEETRLEETRRLGENSRQNGAAKLAFSPDFTVGASITGLTLDCTAGDIAKALYEGVAREISALVVSLGGANGLNVFGGGAKSRVWLDIIGEETGLPVRAEKDPETAARGAFLLAKGAMDCR